MLALCTEMVKNEVLLINIEEIKSMCSFVRTNINHCVSIDDFYQNAIMVIRLSPILLKSSMIDEMDILFVIFSPFIERFYGLISLYEFGWLQEAFSSIQSCFGPAFRFAADNELRYEAINAIFKIRSDSIILNRWTSVLILELLETKVYSALDIIEKYTYLISKDRLWIIEELR